MRKLRPNLKGIHFPESFSNFQNMHVMGERDFLANQKECAGSPQNPNNRLSARNDHKARKIRSGSHPKAQRIEIFSFFFESTSRLEHI